MAISTDIKDIFTDMNKTPASRLFTLVLISFLGFTTVKVFTAKVKVKCEDCSFYKEQNKQLLGALIHVQQIENGTIPVSFTPNLGEIRNDLEFASFSISDTTPRQRAINRYIDSIKLKWKQDSVKQKSKT
jgi:hypothetical protein